MSTGEKGDSLLLVGGNFLPGGFEVFLKEHDPCFGKRFMKSAPECRACRAPVISGGELHLLRDVCMARSRGASSPGKLRRLTSAELAFRLAEGKGIEDVFLEILGDSPRTPEVVQAAREILASRLRYIRDEKGIPVPELPSRSTLQTVAQGG